MKFEVSVEPFDDIQQVETVVVEADDWFAALAVAMDELERPYRMQTLNFSLRDDGLSADVVDSQQSCTYRVQAVAAAEEQKGHLPFAVHVLSFGGKQPARVRRVMAADWFSALQEGLYSLGEPPTMKHLSFSILDDGVSAKVVDPNNARTLIVQALDAEDAEIGDYEEFGGAYMSSDLLQAASFSVSEELLASASPEVEEPKLPPEKVPWPQLLIGLLVRYWWLWFLLFAGGASVTWLVFQFLEIDASSRTMFAVVAGAETVFLASIGLFVRAVVAEHVDRIQWKYATILQRALWILLGVGAVVGLYLVFLRGFSINIWWKTAFFLTIFALFLYGLFNLFSGLLLYGEVYSEMEVGTVRRWISRITALLVVVLCTVFVLLFDFIGGMHWWYYTYVTPQVKAQVTARNRELKSLQLKSLTDRNGRKLGLFQRTQSDWADEYNDPKLMEWRISQAIQLAEGVVQPPAWWWSYLPDGHNLKSEPFSVEGFLRIPYYFLKQRRKVGGSTPALQAAKNFIDFGSSRKGLGLSGTIRTKLFQEIPRSYVMSKFFTPREMMATYMATLWMGRGDNYGIHRMSLYFFGVHNPADLTWNQAAVLASSFPNPGRMNPWYLRSCLQGKCKNQRRAKVFDVWTERIRQLKRKLRRNGHKVPKAFPTFKNGLAALRVISRRTEIQDTHLRKWVATDIPRVRELWENGTNVELSYDHTLTVGPPKTRRKSMAAPGMNSGTRSSKTTRNSELGTRNSQCLQKDKMGRCLLGVQGPTSRKIPTSRPVRKKGKQVVEEKPDSLIDVLKTHLDKYRKRIPTLHITYSLMDSRDGHVISQYGGDLHFDMATARKPVMGSTFKVLTMLVGGYWPDDLPLINRGRGNTPKERKKRRFLYLQTASTGDFVRNSHSMPPYVNKFAALRMSANIGFVFMSLRWTWLVHDQNAWNRIYRVGLEQMYRDRLNYSAERAKRRVDEVFQKPQLFYDDLRERMGYRVYLKKLRARAAFEAGKAAAIQSLLKRRVSRVTLAQLLSSSGAAGFPKFIQSRVYAKQWEYTKKFKGPLTMETMAWLRPLRMEIGLRYLSYLGGLVAGYDVKRDHLQPVMTMTLGVNNTGTHQLAQVAATVAGQRLVKQKWIRAIYRGGQKIYQSKPAEEGRLPVPDKSLPDVKKAMNWVLKWGTAARAGRIVRKKFGAKVLASSGAKTGTVQDSRGVSCVGFLEHRAGAVTISTPGNLRLRSYYLRSYIVNQLEYYKKRTVYWKQQADKATSASAGKYALRQFERYQQLTEKQAQKIKEYEDLAHKFLRMGKKWKYSKFKAEQLQHAAAVTSGRISLAKRQSAVYLSYAQGDMRMINLYERWFQKFKQRAIDLIKKTKEKLAEVERDTLKVIAKADDARKAFAQERHKARQQKQTLEQVRLQYKRLYRKILKNWKKERIRPGGRGRYRSIFQHPAIRKSRRLLRQTLKEKGAAVRRAIRARAAVKRAEYWVKIYKNRRKIVRRRFALASTWEQRKPKVYFTYIKRMANNRERHAKWLRLSKEKLEAAAALEKVRAQQLASSQEWMKQAARQEREYERMEARVTRTHKRWELYSSRACVILFELLSFWKEQDSARAQRGKP